MTEDYAYLGTKLKYLVNITAPGFSMADDQFEITVSRGTKKKVFDKNALVLRNGNYYLCFDSAELGTGEVTATVKAYVPDADFPDRFRTEVFKVNLVKVRRV